MGITLTRVATVSTFYRRVAENAEKIIKSFASSALPRFKIGKFPITFLKVAT
jgi:hypothetical protein